MTCIFCSIGKGTLPSHTISEDEWTKAFLDIKPINPGHVLVIPKRHVSAIHELDEDYYLNLMKTVRKISEALYNKLNPIKVGVAIAGFDIDHLHIHVVPMYDYHDITSKKYLEGQDLEIDKQSLQNMAGKIIRT